MENLGPNDRTVNEHRDQSGWKSNDIVNTGEFASDKIKDQNKNTDLSDDTTNKQSTDQYTHFSGATDSSNLGQNRRDETASLNQQDLGSNI